MRSFNHLIGPTTFVLCSLSTAIATAQPADTSRQQIRGLEEIVVTARRSEESLQSTPVAVAALSREALEKAGVTQVVDLVRATPTLTVATAGPGGTGNIYLAIRGQSKTEANSATDAAVAIYVNGVNYARMTSGNFALFDLAQAEVLRGPQGTLFGRNTTGGALNLSTVQPGGEFGGTLKASVGNFGSRLFEGGVDLPLTDELALRIAGKYETNDGAFDNAVTGKSFKELDKGWGTRATLNWEPSDLPIRLSLVADKAEFKDNGSPSALRAINKDLAPFGPGTPTIGELYALNGLNVDDFLYNGRNFDKVYGAPQTGYSLLDNPYNIGEQEGLAATLDWDIGDWSLKSITVWRSNYSTNSQDLDANPLRLMGFYSIYDQEQFSQELQLSTTIGALDFIGGLFYFKEDGDEQSVSDTFGAFGFIPTGLDLADYESESKAVFGQVNYNFTPKLRGTLGYRYTWDDRSITRRGQLGYEINPNGSVAWAQGKQPFDESFSYPAWIVGLDYQVTDDMFLYTKVGRASMAGGFNTRPTPPGREAFDPEELTDFEVGMKLDSFDGRLRTNAALFAIETKGVQRIVNAIVDDRITQYTQNAGDTRTYGFEFETTALLWDGMELSAGVAYLDANYKNGTFIDNAGTLDDPIPYDRSSEVVPNAPEWTYNITASQSFDLELGTLSAQVGYAYVDDKAIGAETAPPGATDAQNQDIAMANKYLTLKSYGLWNSRVAMDFHNGVSVALWGHNLSNEEYFAFAFNAYSSLGFTTQSQGMPRTYGLEVKYDF